MKAIMAANEAYGSSVRDLLIVTDRDLARLTVLPPHAQLQYELDRAIVVSSEAVPPDVITMNSHVRYVDEATGERRSVKIVYPDEADARLGKISVLAPVGAALLGLSVGQSIEWDFPGGRRRIRVEKVIHQPERVAVTAARLRIDPSHCI
jgi:regulator of nucleoside diphosphate kinase